MQSITYHLPACLLYNKRVVFLGNHYFPIDSCKSSYNRQGCNGISRTRIPNGKRALSMAEAKRAGTGMTPASPAPFTPKGLSGEGVSTCSTRIDGISAAVGIK